MFRVSDIKNIINEITILLTLNIFKQEFFILFNVTLIQFLKFTKFKL